MIQQVRTVLPYSLLYISDFDGGELPEPNDGSIWFTQSCIAVSCVAFSDSATEVIFGWARELDRSDAPAFDIDLDIPSRRVLLSTAEDDAIFSEDIHGTEIRVRIWLNRTVEPDIVTVGLGEIDR